MDAMNKITERIQRALCNRWCALLGSFLVVQLTAECGIFENHAVYLASVMACHSIGYEKCGGDSTMSDEESSVFADAYSRALNNMSIVYTLFIVCQGLGMGFGGHFQKKTSLRCSIIVGVFFVCVSTACVGWALYSVWSTLILFGIVQGLGVGFIYMAGVSIVNLWFGENLLALWIGVSSSTMAPSLIDPMQSDLINPNNHAISSEYGFMRDSEILESTPMAMIYTALLYLVLGVIGTMLIYEPRMSDDSYDPIQDAVVVDEKAQCKTTVKKKYHTTDVVGLTMTNEAHPCYSGAKTDPCGAVAASPSSITNSAVIQGMSTYQSPSLSLLIFPSLRSKEECREVSIQKNCEDGDSAVLLAVKNSEESVPLSQAFYYREFWYLALISFSNLFGSYWVMSTWKVFGSQYLGIGSDYFLSRVGGIAALMSGLMRAVCSVLYDYCLKGRFKGLYGSLLLLFSLATLLCPFIPMFVGQSRSSIIDALFLTVVSMQFTSVCIVYNLFPAMVRQTFGPRYVSEIAGFLWGLEGPAMLLACGLFLLVPNVISWFAAQLIAGVMSMIAVIALVVYPTAQQSGDKPGNTNAQQVRRMFSEEKNGQRKRMNRHGLSDLVQMAFQANPLPHGPH